MSQFSKITKQQLTAYERTFSTTLNTNYKNAFIQCRKSNINCDDMQKELDKVNNSLNSVQALAATINAKVDKEKSDISNYQVDLKEQKSQWSNKLNILNSVNDVDNASKTLRKNKKTSMTYEYFTLAYYVLANIAIVFLLHKQYKFSALYFLAVFLVILIVIFVLAWWGIPYN